MHICIQPQEDLVRDFEGMNWNSISENQVRSLEKRFEEVGEGGVDAAISVCFQG